METRKTFTGLARRRTTRWTVRLGEVVSRTLITIGGLGTIVAVAAVFLFLLWVVKDLFRPAEITNRSTFASPWKPNQPIRIAVDDEQIMGWALLPDGALSLFRLDNGQELKRTQLFTTPVLTSAAFAIDEPDAVFGFEDGSVCQAKIRFTTRFLDATPDELRELAEGQAAPFQDGMAVRTSQGQIRVLELEVTLQKPAKPESPSSIRLIDLAITTTGTVICTFNEEGKLRLNTVREQTNLLTGDVTYRLTGSELPYKPRIGIGPPQWLFLSAGGDQVYLFWPDGHMMRFNANMSSGPELVEERDLLEDENIQVTIVASMIGKGTYLVGDSTGRLRAWCYANATEAGTKDRGTLVCAHELRGPGAAVTALAMSSRSRMTGVGYADGRIHLYYITSENLMSEEQRTDRLPISLLALAPKEDGLIALVGSEVWRCTFNPRHPETTLSSLFTKVHYEGYEQPQHVWQSTSGRDAPEAKLGLWPLVFGTLKASFYSLLFGVPIALLAAIYTSEFLHPRTKSVIKPTIELMASLPSVVLGFLAGLVFSQFVEKVLPSVLASLYTVPLAFCVAAYLWQLLPEKASLRLARWRFLFMFAVMPLGLLAGALLGPLLENLLFAGDLRGWLDGMEGSSVGGWVLLLIPLSAAGTIYALNRWVNPWLRRRSVTWERHPIALADLAKLVLGVLMTVIGAWVLGLFLDFAGCDPRGGTARSGFVNRMILGVPLVLLGLALVQSRLINPWLEDKADNWSKTRLLLLKGVCFTAVFILALAVDYLLALGLQQLDFEANWFGTYSQRNALVVGVVMGFAIIPIIYTISEDALSAVPEHLRAGSLAAGATPWQTATRIVVPTAMSGMFSAVMIGLGRAVGETMIVLMATGNTPVMDWSIFSGFRTLSANIAVELPEAVRGSTHYLTLFLAALVLFGLTFVLNTLAEIVRLRFRRRAYQL